MPLADGNLTVGVLALQGGYDAHARVLQKLGVKALEVRTTEELQQCHGLILPGGESTTMTKLLEERQLRKPLQEFATSHPLFGTCAGMILMAKEGILDVAIERNAYGRQIASFTTSLSIENTTLSAVFIRAPKIKALLSFSIEVLASYQGSPVLIKQNHHLAASFHPELTEETFIHELFLEEIKKRLVLQQVV